jgi:hypothetical protein
LARQFCSRCETGVPERKELAISIQYCGLRSGGTEIDAKAESTLLSHDWARSQQCTIL